MNPPRQQTLRRPGLRERCLASIWTIPAVVLPIIAAILVWFAYDEYEETLEQEYRFLEAHARIAEGQLAGLLRNIKQLLGRVAEEWPAMPAERLAAFEATLAERKLDFPEIRTLAVLDGDGRVQITVNPSLKGFDGSRRDYFTAHLAQAQHPNFYISRPFKSSFGDYSVTFSIAMRDDAQRLLGVVVAGVNYKFFESMMKHIKPAGDSSIAAVFNEHGDVIYRLPDPDKYAGVSIASGRPFQQYLRSGQPMSRSIATAKVDGVRRIYVHRAIGNTGLGLAVARPLDEVLAEWRRNLVLRGLIFAVAAAVTLYLAWLAHRHQRTMLAGKDFTDQLIETANVMLVGLDPEGAVVIFNEAAERISGYRREEVLGRNWFDLVVPRERYPAVREALRAFEEPGAMPRTFENPILTRAGGERVIAWQNSEMERRGALATRICFGIDITERQHMEQVRRNEEVSRRLVSIQEEERRRLAVELHDRTSPNLSALDINLRSLGRSLPPESSRQLADLLEDTSALLDDTITSIRAVSVDFRPPVLDYAGLWPALESYAREFGHRTGMAVSAVAQREPDFRFVPDIETNLFRIAQEALMNCARHSRARSVRIVHAQNGDVVELAIVDDGVGFDPDAVARGAGVAGYGLTTMRKRAEFIGARFSLESFAGKGTRITVEIPALRAVGSRPRPAAVAADGTAPGSPLGACA